MMTTVYTGKLNASCGDGYIDYLMCELREKTGHNWQIAHRVHHEKRWFKKPVEHHTYDLLLEVGGVLPYQLIMCGSGNADKVIAYIIGYLSGLSERVTHDV